LDRVRSPLLIFASLLGVLGVLAPGAGGGTVFAFAWTALAAPAAGHLAGAAPGRPLRLAVPLIVWAVVLGGFVLLAAAPASFWVAPAIAGLFLLGTATGRLTEDVWSGAALWLTLALALAGAPLGYGQLAGPLPPEWTARLLDLSPLSLVLESAGVDWMRHPAVYDAAGTLDIGPELRQAWRGMVAGPALFVVGCFALAASSACRARTAVPPPAAHRENH
jgi:hypothetical protein